MANGWDAFQNLVGSIWEDLCLFFSVNYDYDDVLIKSTWEISKKLIKRKKFILCPMYKSYFSLILTSLTDRCESNKCLQNLAEVRFWRQIDSYCFWGPLSKSVLLLKRYCTSKWASIRLSDDIIPLLNVPHNCLCTWFLKFPSNIKRIKRTLDFLIYFYYL